MEIGSSVVRFQDTCNVYLLRSGSEAILIDFGDGAILDHLSEYEVDRVTDVLMTHHHRDNAQGLARAAAAGIRIWVPPTERDLFANVEQHWQSREIDNLYDLREDRFSLLDDVPISGVVTEYRMRRYGAIDVLALPTPGHTAGSESYIVEIDGRRLCFSGDLLYGPGKVWSLAATQWTYSGIEGLGGTILSGLDLLDREPDLLLPSHGDPIDEPAEAIRLLNGRLQALIDLRTPEWQLEELRARPYVPISSHLLRNRTSVSNSYVLLSDSGSALLIDYGYDFTTGLPAGTDRSSRRPWLATINALRRDFGVDRVEVAIPTHYHDDHVAGFNLLRDIEGTEVWAPENMVAIFEQPKRFDLPCVWWDPIGVDRVLRFDRPFNWHEYELSIHPLPGHTLFAVAIEFAADGRRIVATGDQQNGLWVPGQLPETLNYQYRNLFRIDDFVRSAELYRRLEPDLMISGHWLPRPVTQEYLDMLLTAGEDLARLHRELLPLEEVDLGATGFAARIEPYRSELQPGGGLDLVVSVRNPFPSADTVTVRCVTPRGWTVDPPEQSIAVPARSDAVAGFRLGAPPSASPARRVRIAADVTVGSVRFGQQAEALVDVASAL